MHPYNFIYMYMYNVRPIACVISFMSITKIKGDSLLKIQDLVIYLIRNGVCVLYYVVIGDR